MKKERVFYLDFIRAISVIIIVAFHFNCTLISSGVNGYNKILYKFSNGDWGAIGVTLFFIISGVGLMHSYGKQDEKIDLKLYFKKRFLKLYPMFWIAYIIIFLYNFYCSGHIPYLNKFKMLITIAGMDGYLLYLEPNFYIIGEWFLGAIILVYLLFPILKYISDKFPKIYIITLTIASLLLCIFNPFKIHPSRNIISCIFCFSIGMYFEKYVKEIKIYHFIVAMIIASIIYFIKLNLHFTILMNILGILMFVIFVYISKFINIAMLKELCVYIGKYSYAIFLLHHYILVKIIDKFKGMYLSITETMCLFLMSFLIIMVFSIILSKLTDKILYKFKNIEWKILPLKK